LEQHNVKIKPTAFASPWSNGIAESNIKNIKHAFRKLLMQEKQHKNWDELLHYVTIAHNSMTNKHGLIPETLMFGYKRPLSTDIISSQPLPTDFNDPHNYLILLKATLEKLHKKHYLKQTVENAKSRAYKNKYRKFKTFNVGDIVALRQTQFATSQANAFNPILIGPFRVLEIEHNSIAIIQNLKTHEISRAHFTNIEHITVDPTANRLSNRSPFNKIEK
jgi:hypothetical protein